MPPIVIVGAGMGGLAAAIRLAQQGRKVVVCEASARPGGLAAGFELEGFPFDAGPYILLDRRGLDWAFQQLGLNTSELQLNRIEEVYETNLGEEPLCIFNSLERTTAEIERRWPGSGVKYRIFIERMAARYARLQPLQCGLPGLGRLLLSRAWRDLPFLTRSLQQVLAESQLPQTVAEALGIWTHVAGQSMATAPAPLALVPAVIHSVGAYYPRGGIGTVPAHLFAAAQRLDIEFHFETTIRSIRCEAGRATGIELTTGEVLPASAVISNVGLGTYLHLLDAEGTARIPHQALQSLKTLPLQSPGVCAYLAVRGETKPPYLRFQIHSEPDGCRLLVMPGVIDPTVQRGEWFPTRLLAPMHHDRAESGGEAGQQAFLERVLAEPWWRKHFTEVRILATRIPLQWGKKYHLFRNSMNPVMTAAFMRAGRLAHRSPWIRNLYLTGSATHPGQWVSFCAVSGVLTANEVLREVKA